MDARTQLIFFYGSEVKLKSDAQHNGSWFPRLNSALWMHSVRRMDAVFFRAEKKAGRLVLDARASLEGCFYYRSSSSSPPPTPTLVLASRIGSEERKLTRPIVR